MYQVVPVIPVRHESLLWVFQSGDIYGDIGGEERIIPVLQLWFLIVWV